MKNLYEIKNIKKTDIFEGISLDVNKGEVLGIYSTESNLNVLYDCMSLIDDIDGGDIRLNEKSIAKLSGDDKSRIRGLEIGVSNIDYLPKDFTVGELLHIVLKPLRETKEQKEVRVVNTLKFLDLDNKILKSLTEDLEPSIKVKISIALGIVGSPKILMMFIPDLEKKSLISIQNNLTRIAKEKGISIIEFADDWSRIKASKVYKLKNGKLGK